MSAIVLLDLYPNVGAYAKTVKCASLSKGLGIWAFVTKKKATPQRLKYLFCFLLNVNVKFCLLILNKNIVKYMQQFY